jgi:molybdate/tungstate transport system permease protein
MDKSNVPRAPGHRPARLAAQLLVAGLSALLVVFVAGPLLRLLLAAEPASLRTALGDPEVRASILLTVGAAAAATALALLGGVPLAWLLARRRFPGRRAIEALLDLPVVVPHPVAGIALLLFLGRESPVGRVLARAGLEVVNHVPGIVAAMLFVSVPLLVSAAREAFTAVDPRLERVARTLGDRPATVFRRVTLPLAARPILAGAVLAWARSVSEFGAVVVLTYNPKVGSILTFDRFTTGGLAAAVPVAVLLLAVALVVTAVARLLVRERAP